MADTDRKAGIADEAALRPFFAAARAAEPPVRTDFLSAILADAAAVRAAPPPAAVPRRRRLAAIGGWRGLAALAASAAVGFWLGTTGALPVDETATSESATVADSAGPVADFFDLAAAGD